MRNNTKVFIKEFANQIREENNIKDYDSLITFIYSIGGKIEKPDCLFDEYSIVKVSDKKFIIYTDIFDVDEKILYNSISNCLGNLFLHLGYIYFEDALDTWKNISNGEVFSKNNWNNEQYEQAKLFADNLIMPEEEYRELIYKYTDWENMIDVGKVAEYFNVTFNTAKARGIKLKLIKSILDY